MGKVTIPPSGTIDGIVDVRDSRWVSASGTVYPHYITVVMKKEYTVNRFQVFDDPTSPGPHMADNFKLLVSNDTIIWTSLGVFTYGQTIRGGQFYEVSLYKWRYFKFVGINGTRIDLIRVEEINVFGW